MVLRGGTVAEKASTCTPTLQSVLTKLGETVSLAPLPIPPLPALVPPVQLGPLMPLAPTTSPRSCGPLLDRMRVVMRINDRWYARAEGKSEGAHGATPMEAMSAALAAT